MTDMSKITPEDVKQAEQNLKAKSPVQQADFELEISFPPMTTPRWIVVLGGFLLLTAGGKNASMELIVGGSLAVVGGLLEFVDRRWHRGVKISR